jgi:hypothetical protein
MFEDEVCNTTKKRIVPWLLDWPKVQFNIVNNTNGIKIGRSRDRKIRVMNAVCHESSEVGAVIQHNFEQIDIDDFSRMRPK